MEKHILEEKKLVQDFSSKLESTSPLKSFISQSSDIGLNLCLMQRCGQDPAGSKCSNENDLTKHIMQCLSSKGFLGEYGIKRTDLDKQYCQMRCEIRQGIEPTSNQFFLNSKSQQMHLIELFMNPYNEYDCFFSLVNTCILRDKKIWSYFMDIKKNKIPFFDKEFDELCRTSQDTCFKKTFSGKFTPLEQKILSCTYYCNQFDPAIKNKIREYGHQIQQGKHQTYKKDLRFKDLK